MKVENWKNFVDCVYKNKNGQYRWKSKMTNDDARKVFYCFKKENGNYDKNNIYNFVCEIEGHVKRSTFNLNFAKFINNVHSKKRDWFSKLKFKGLYQLIPKDINNIEIGLKRHIGKLKRKNKLLVSKIAQLKKIAIIPITSLKDNAMKVCELMALSVSYENISNIYNLFNKSICIRSIYNKKFNFMYLTEAATAHMLQGLLNKGHDFTLHHDETTMGLHKLQGFILTAINGVDDYQLKQILIAIEKVPTKSSNYQLQVLISALDRMDEILDTNGNLKKQFLLTINACMADGAATSLAFNKLLDEERSNITQLGKMESVKTLTLKQCCIHAANNISKELINVIDSVNHEFSLRIKFLAKTLNFKNAAYHPIASDFYNFQISKGIQYPKSLNELAGHRFMFLNEIALQIINQKYLILEYMEKCLNTYSENSLINDYLKDEDFMKQVNLCVLLHVICVEPIKHMVASDLLNINEHEYFRNILESIMCAIEDEIKLEALEIIIPTKFKFAFQFAKLQEIKFSELPADYCVIFNSLKTSIIQRYLSQPLDDVHSFYNNINLERVFAMVKRSNDMAPNKDIYTRIQQIKARYNSSIKYIKESHLIDPISYKDLTEKGTWMKNKFSEHLKWVANERMKILQIKEQTQSAKKRKKDLKLVVQELLDADIMDVISLRIAISSIPIKSDREKILKHQLQMLRILGLNYTNDRPWLSQCLSSEEILLSKIECLQAVEL